MNHWWDPSLPFWPGNVGGHSWHGDSSGAMSCQMDDTACGPGGPAVCVIGSQGNLPYAGTQTQYCFGSMSLAGSPCTSPAGCPGA